MKIDRLLSILILLLKKEKITAPELAAYFETSLRTIYRDMDTLSQAGIPIASEQGHGGGYFLMPGFTLDRQVLKVDELVTLMAGLKGLQGIDEGTSLRQTYEKISALTKEEKDILEIDFFGWDAGNRQQNMIRLIRKAITQNSLLGFAYTNLKNETLYRETEPYKIFFRGSNWYLLAWCCVRKDYRFFRISRMDELKILSKSFMPREPESGDNWTPSFPDSSSKVPELHLHITDSGVIRAREFFSPDHIIERNDKSIEVKVLFPADEWLYSYLLGYGNTLTVLDPPEIREELLSRANAFINNHRLLEKK